MTEGELAIVTAALEEEGDRWMRRLAQTFSDDTLSQIVNNHLAPPQVRKAAADVRKARRAS